MTIESVLREVAECYPPEMVAGQISGIPRTAFHIRLALNGSAPSGLSVCDIGGGLGLFSPGCAALGMKVLLIDDFADPVNRTTDERQFAVHKKYGVQVIARDVIAGGVADLGERTDIVTCFDTMEHWHNSPKKLFKEVRESLLRPGGRIVLAVPNCVNLRKRITVPFGIGRWSSMATWYEEPVFRGHVREAAVSDLRYIARDMALKDIRIQGRNWFGRRSRFAFVRAGNRLLDVPLRLRPSLCSNLYLTGHT